MSGAPGIDFGRFEALTFDCYGTLIDWESGILAALRPLAPHGVELPEGGLLLEAFGRLEAEAEHGRFRPYREVLTSVAQGFGELLGAEISDEAAAAFAASVAVWPPFPDSVDALEELAERYRLAIVSNVDDDLFAGSASQLRVPFAEVVTAQQVLSYKPRPEHFHEVLRRLGLPKDRVLHVAQSLFHDIAPAKALGLTCVWVNRRAGKVGGGATPPAEATPDLEVPDLAALAAAARSVEST